MMQVDDFIKKARLPKAGHLINAPIDIQSAFVSMGYFDQTLKVGNQVTLVFLENGTAFSKIMPDLMAKLAYDELLWLCYPKSSSSIKSDLNRTVLWKMMEQYGVRPVTNLSFDLTWSALRFRPIDAVKSK